MSDDHKNVVSMHAWPPEPERYSGGHGRSLGQYETPARLCEKTMRLLLGCVVTSLLFATVKTGEGISPDITDTLVGLGAAMLDLGVFIASQACFYMWVYRVCANVRALGAKGLSISPGWTVGYFFIPILNFFMPYQALRDVWRASMPGLDLQMQPESGWRAPSNSKLCWWWAVVVLEPLVILFGLVFLIWTQPGYLAFLWTLMAMRLAKAVVTIIFIKALTARQDEAYRRLQGTDL